MKRLIIGVVACFGFGLFLIFRPSKGQEAYSLAYSTQPSKNIAYSRKQTGEELKDAVKATTEIKKVDGVQTGSAGNEQLDKVIEAGKSKLGAPYIWGAKGPDTFDCSGFVGWCYEQVGINIVGSTYSQVNVGEPINAHDMSQWKPGDLILPNAGHIVMYLGDGQVIHAPKKNDVVKISKVYWNINDTYAVRRIVK